VVVLDFWASWCGPCVAALPLISEATKARADKGVVFYAVNQQEEVAAIKAFLQGKKLEIPVALDVEGAAAKLYQVRGIPQTVVIDKEGKVAVVHVGFSPQLKETLARELDALLLK
jgi:thiol-disulfide isomerase/thioredoxin